MNKLDFVEIINETIEMPEIEMPKSRVYAKLDEQKRILAIEGEYSLSSIQNFDEWTQIEEGEPCDRLNLAQSHYFEGGLYTMDGIPLYKWDGEQVVARGEDEIEADRAAIPKPPVGPTYEERLSAMESAILTMAMALGGD